MQFHVRPANEGDRPEWLRLRQALWPGEPLTELEPDLAEYLNRADTHLALVAARPQGGLAGFAEFRLRSFADDCYTSPVAYLEGWYVDPDSRQRGIGGRLVAAAGPWAKARGCREFGSDTHVENLLSRAAHRALGFDEGPPVVHFHRAI